MDEKLIERFIAALASTTNIQFYPENVRRALEESGTAIVQDWRPIAEAPRDRLVVVRAPSKVETVAVSRDGLPWVFVGHRGDSPLGWEPTEYREIFTD